MTEISKIIIEKFDLKLTNKHIGSSFFMGSTIYRVSSLCTNAHMVYLANCDEHGLTHLNDMLYIYVNSTQNCMAFSKELLESEQGFKVVKNKVEEIIQTDITTDDQTSSESK